jgi:hypothetical protein
LATMDGTCFGPKGKDQDTPILREHYPKNDRGTEWRISQS